MGRYYNGDIEGKFWVAVQPSNAADQFGVELHGSVSTVLSSLGSSDDGCSDCEFHF